MIDDWLTNQLATSFLSNTVGNEIKRNVNFVNCDTMIDSVV